MTSSEIVKSSTASSPDSQALGSVIRRILRCSADATAVTAAKRLGVSAQRLRHVINGNGPASRRWAAQYRVAEVLAEHYPEGWSLYGAEFHLAVEALPFAPGAPKHLRAETNSFGAVLWAIIGENHAEAALALSIKPTTLSAILCGKLQVTQRMITQKGWRAALASRYPHAWQTKADAFERCAAKLKSRPGGSAHQDSRNTDFGTLLGSLLDLSGADHRDAAQCLRVSSSMLSQIIHGRTRVSRRFIENRRWREALSKHYPAAYTIMAPQLELSILTLQKSPGKQPKHKIHS